MDELRAGRLAALAKHTAWPELVEWADEYKQRYMDYLAAVLIATGEVPDDLEYKRGFLAGMKHVSRYPGAAVKQLERDVAKSKEVDEVVS